MCGRYFIDDETMQEMESVLRRIGERVSLEMGDCTLPLARDIRPTDCAPVLAEAGGKLCCRWQRWGLPGFQKGQVIFNARSETALERPLFRESAERRRIVVPARWFYEWSREKEKNRFYRADSPLLFLAGIYSRRQEEDRFVILTTGANDSMRQVHDRMPLILEPEEAAAWIFDGSKTKDLLQKVPCVLERRAEYEQLRLF